MANQENSFSIPIPRINKDGELQDIVTLDDHIKLFFQEHRNNHELVEYIVHQLDNYDSLHQRLSSLESRTVKELAAAIIVFLFSLVLIKENTIMSAESGLGIALLIAAVLLFWDALSIRSTIKEAETEFLKPSKSRRVTSQLAQQGIEYLEARRRIMGIVKEYFHYTISEKDMQKFLDLFNDGINKTAHDSDSSNQDGSFEDLLRRQQEFSGLTRTGVALKDLLTSINSTEIPDEIDPDDEEDEFNLSGM